jgi:hypothetical protein
MGNLSFIKQFIQIILLICCSISSKCPFLHCLHLFFYYLLLNCKLLHLRSYDLIISMIKLAFLLIDFILNDLSVQHYFVDIFLYVQMLFYLFYFTPLSSIVVLLIHWNCPYFGVDFQYFWVEVIILGLIFTH